MEPAEEAESNGLHLLVCLSGKNVIGRVLDVPHWNLLVKIDLFRFSNIQDVDLWQPLFKLVKLILLFLNLNCLSLLDNFFFQGQAGLISHPVLFQVPKIFLEFFVRGRQLFFVGLQKLKELLWGHIVVGDQGW